jgi:hypothetical protein
MRRVGNLQRYVDNEKKKKKKKRKEERKGEGEVEYKSTNYLLHPPLSIILSAHHRLYGAALIVLYYLMK